MTQPLSRKRLIGNEPCPKCGCDVEDGFCLAGHNQREFSIPHTLRDYAIRARETAIYPGRGSLHGLLYATIGLGGEAGEMLNKVKKILRDSNGVVQAWHKEAISGELGDILWYVVAVCDELKINVQEVAQANIEKLAQRKATGTIGGSGETPDLRKKFNNETAGDEEVTPDDTR